MTIWMGGGKRPAGGVSLVLVLTEWLFTGPRCRFGR